MKKKFFFITFLSFKLTLISQILISEGSSWKYLDDGSNQETFWQNLSYDDSAWSTGNSQLGYGDGDENTVISYGDTSSNKHICYYFRKIIDITNPSSNTGLKISILRDDGAVVYINGVEVIRSNMPSGDIYYNTFAASTVSGSNEDTFYEYQIPSTTLNTGQNIVAIEIHQRSQSSSDVSFDFKLEFTELNSFKKVPYVLYPGNNDQMLVTWQLINTETCELKYGTDTNYTLGTINTTEYGSDHQHKVLLNGLTPEQKYYFKVTTNNTTIKYGSFNTGLSDTENSVTFFAYGDTRTNPEDHDTVAARIFSDINQNNLNQTFILNSGDLVSNGDSENSWDDEFFNQSYTNITYLLANLPYLTAIGNHEGQGELFEKYFPYPMFMNNRYYFSFDYGPVHVTAIDQETDYSQGSVQYNWIVNDLSSSNKTWKIVVLHKPGWSAGGHSNSTDVQNILQPLFEQHQVSLVLTGHNHYYARAIVNNVQHITTGGGGAPLYSPDASYPNIVTVDQSNHYCKLEINGENLHFSAIRSDGSLIEDFSIQSYTTGIDENQLDNNWYVYTYDNKIIVKTKKLDGKIEIYDNLGRLVYKSMVRDELTYYPEEGTGVFFVRYIVDGKFNVKKVIAYK